MTNKEITKLKPPLTFKEQLLKLQERGLEIDDEGIALEKLRMCNYYRLSAYTLHLKENDIFMPGTTFKQIARLYDFDTHLRNLLLPMLERIEIAFRTHVAYLLATNYGNPQSYRNPSIFTDQNKHNDFLKKIDAEINKASDAFIRHHKQHYDGQYPIWVVVEIMSFGTLSKLYENLKPYDQKQISSIYSIGSSYTIKWLHTLSYIRNLCAHYSRLYNRTLTKSPQLFRSERKQIDNTKIFAGILIMKRLNIDNQAWDTFITSLIGLIESYEDVVDLQLIGFPLNWLDLLNKPSYKHTDT